MSQDPYRTPASDLQAVADPKAGRGIFWFLFSLTGRSSRAHVLIVYGAAFIGQVLGHGFLLDDQYNDRELTRITLISVLPFLWTGIAVQVRRWHDLNMSGWWVLVYFIPVVGGIMWICAQLALLLWRGVDEDNDYGPAP